MATKPVFEHRHYKKIAHIIAQAKRYGIVGGQHEHVAEWFAEELKGTNPAFNRERFLAAALGQPSNGRDKVR